MDRIRKLFLRNAAPEEAHEPPLRTGVFRRRRNSSKTSKRTQDSTESGVRRSRNKSQGGKHTNRRSRGGSISHNKKFLKNIGAKTKERVRKVRTLTDSRIHGSKPSELVRKSVENRSQSKCSNSRRKAVHPETAEKRRRAKYGKVSETKVEDFTKFETVSAAARPAVSKNLARAKRKHKHSNRNEQRGAEGSVAKEMENSLMTSTPKSQTGSGWTITEEQSGISSRKEQTSSDHPGSSSKTYRSGEHPSHSPGKTEASSDRELVTAKEAGPSMPHEESKPLSDAAEIHSENSPFLNGQLECREVRSVRATKDEEMPSFSFICKTVSSTLLQILAQASKRRSGGPGRRAAMVARLRLGRFNHATKVSGQ
ncbi:hypothetical protein RB195_018111 [Necator americanus]|uniref:Uncharacterized protein n=1 Tax=Necator americanus TaxID=51031 RepID=A0ABR1C882_NECAM